MTKQRFERYLLDGGFSFGDEQIPPRWSINDRYKNSPFIFLEFEDEYKDLCDEIVDALNMQYEQIQFLEKNNEQLKQDNNALISLLENQSIIIQELHSKLLEYQLEEPITLTKEDLEIMGKAISYYLRG